MMKKIAAIILVGCMCFSAGVFAGEVENAEDEKSFFDLITIFLIDPIFIMENKSRSRLRASACLFCWVIVFCC